MKVVIDIPEEEYNDIKYYGTIVDEDRDYIAECILNGTPLEEHCNNCETGNPCLYCKHSFEERGEQDADSD